MTRYDWWPDPSPEYVFPTEPEGVYGPVSQLRAAWRTDNQLEYRPRTIGRGVVGRVCGTHADWLETFMRRWLVLRYARGNR